MDALKRLSAPLLLALTLVLGALFALAPMPALAEDSDVAPASSVDQYYYFDFQYYGDEKATAPVNKDNDTASYFYTYNMTIYDCHLYIDGHDGYGNYYNMTVGGYAYLVDPGQWWIHNYVYENGYPQARLRGLSSQSGVLEGFWSADSTGTYGSLN